MQQQESELLMKLKASHEAREKAEQSLIHARLLVSQREVKRLVHDLQHTAKNKMLLDLQRLNTEISHAVLPHHHAGNSDAAVHGADASKFKQQQKTTQTPSTTSTSTSTSTSSSTPDNKQILASATDEIDAQVDGILNSDELKYIKDHAGDDSSDSEDDTVTETDSGAAPGETPDEHYRRLSHEADALMAEAYPFIKCSLGAASGGSASASGGTGGSGTTGGSGGTAASGNSGGTAASGNSTTTGSGAAASGSGASGASAASGAAAAGASGATGGTAAGSGAVSGAAAATGASAATGATAAGGGSSSSSTA